MAKNIVICCDGTGDKFSNENSNVIKLYSALDLDDPARQIAFYHPGLGTMGAPNALTRIAKWWTKILGLAFGHGITGDIGDAYRFLMDNFEADDRIFLFGFSRGAFTVRALSGLLHMFGLLRKGNEILIPYATDMLKSPQKETFQIAKGFKATLSRECKPHFIGVWDTVSSVGWITDPVHIPYTAKNPDLSVARQALSIDERRCYFRQNLWSAPGPGQDIRQVWFAGVHADVGGGYPENESGLALISLEWMLRQAQQFGLTLKQDMVDRLLGRKDPSEVRPDATAPLHNSLLEGPWLLLEILPHRFIDTTCDPPVTRWKLPLAARRHIAAKSMVHESVEQRMALCPDYRPANLPEDRVIERDPGGPFRAEAAG